MSGQLQVRQIHLDKYIGNERSAEASLSYGPWVDVPSPGWLVGFVLPYPGFAYEFRTVQEGK